MVTKPLKYIRVPGTGLVVLNAATPQVRKETIYEE